MVWVWAYRYMLLPFIGAGACLAAAVLSWRALRSPAPIPIETTFYPNASVSLESCSVSMDGIAPARPGWTKSFREFTAGVIRAAGEYLAEKGGEYTVWVAAECEKAGVRYSIRYRGKADEEAVERLGAEIDRLPTFSLPDGTVKLTLRFLVRGNRQIPPQG